MSVDRRKVAVLGSGLALRLFLFTVFPSLPDLLTGRVEVSTPVNSFKRLQEGLFLHSHQVSPYDGGIFHQAPLLLSLFSLLPKPGDHPLWTGFLYSLLDLSNANALLDIAASGESVSSALYTSSRKDIRYDGPIISAAYLFNPFTIAACLGRSTAAFTNTAILHALSNAVRGNTINSMLALALASYLSLYPVLLLPPLALLCFQRRSKTDGLSKDGITFAMQEICILSIGVFGLLYTSYLICGGSWAFIPATYGAQLLVPDLTPNVGLWWYFFIEIFDSFRDFFLGVFWLHIVGYVGGLTIRLSHQPLFVLTTLLGIFAIFKPYPSISDVSLYFSLLPLYRHIFPLMRYTFVAVSTLLYATLLGPAFYHLWIYAGSGNANFFYAITLVWSLGLSIVVGDSLFAVLRDEWELERPEMKGKEVKRI